MGVYKQNPRAYEKLTDPRSIADVLADMGVVYFETGDCGLAIGHFERAFNLAERIGYEAVMANVLNSLGIVFSVQGQCDSALLHVQDCLARYARLADDLGLAQAYNNLGMIYMEKKDWASSIDSFDKGLDIAQRMENLYLIATLYVNKADVNVRKADYSAASHFCRMAMGLYQRIEDPRGLAEIEKIQGLIALSDHKWQLAQDHLINALDISVRHGTYFSTAEIYRELGSYYRKRRFRRKATSAYSDSLIRYERLGSSHRASSVKRELSQLRNG